MSRLYQFKAGMTIWAKSEDEAVEVCANLCHVINKDADGPRIWLEPETAVVIDDDDSN